MNEITQWQIVGVDTRGIGIFPANPFLRAAQITLRRATRPWPPPGAWAAVISLFLRERVVKSSTNTLPVASRLLKWVTKHRIKLYLPAPNLR